MRSWRRKVMRSKDGMAMVTAFYRSWIPRDFEMVYVYSEAQKVSQTQ